MRAVLLVSLLGLVFAAVPAGSAQSLESLRRLRNSGAALGQGSDSLGGTDGLAAMGMSDGGDGYGLDDSMAGVTGTGGYPQSSLGGNSQRFGTGQELFRNAPLPTLPADYPGGKYLRSYPMTPLTSVPAEALFPRSYRRVQERQQRELLRRKTLGESENSSALSAGGEQDLSRELASPRDKRAASSPQRGMKASTPLRRDESQEALRGAMDSDSRRERNRAREEGSFDDEGRGKRSVPMTEDQLEAFGYEFFEGPPERFFVSPSAAVPADYLIGPEDGFMVHAWNKLQDLTLPLQVDRKGMIHLPNVGEFFVWGLSVGKMEELLRTELSRQFTDLKLTVSMVSLRKLAVYVVGEVRKPGMHLLSGLSTCINALVAAGGPSDRGTLRDIRIRRGKKTLATFDLYDFLLRGDRSADRRLSDGDVVVVGLRGPTAAVAGYVRRPAIYEIGAKTSLKDLLALAGGIRPDGFAPLVHLVRPTAQRRREARDLQLPAQEGLAIEDGDLLRVDPVYDVVENVVLIEGNVERPGAYQWHDGMRVSDLLRLGRRILPKTHMGRADLVRYLGAAHRYGGRAGVPERTLDTEVVAIDLGALRDGDDAWDWPLRPLDRLVVHHRDEVLPPLSVEISGEIEHEGLFPLTAGMRLCDLVSLAGGMKRSAFALRVEVGRVLSSSPFRTEVLEVDLGKALAGDPKHDIELMPDDRVFVKQVPEFDLQRYVTLEGELRFPGRYLFNPGDRLQDVIRRAGGYTSRAFLPGAFFTREAVREVQGQKLAEFRQEQRMRLNQLQQDLSTSVGFIDPKEKEVQMASIRSRETMLQAVEGIEPNGRIVMHLSTEGGDFEKSRYNVQLEAEDRLRIPPLPAEITVIGEVLQPGSMLFEPGHTVGWYLEKVGGMTRRADHSLISILRADGTTVSRLAYKRRRSYWSYDVRTKRWTRIAGSFDRIRVEQGDVLLVPGRIALRRNRSREVIDAVYKSAVSIGALAGLFK